MTFERRVRDHVPTPCDRCGQRVAASRRAELLAAAEGRELALIQDRHVLPVAGYACPGSPSRVEAIRQGGAVKEAWVRLREMCRKYDLP